MPTLGVRIPRLFVATRERSLLVPGTKVTGHPSELVALVLPEG